MSVQDPPIAMHRLPRRVSAWVALNTARANLKSALDLVNEALIDLTPRHYLEGDVLPVATGKEVRLRREALGLSQRELALEASMSRSALYALETGARETPRSLLHVGQTLARLEEAAIRG